MQLNCPGHDNTSASWCDDNAAPAVVNDASYVGSYLQITPFFLDHPPIKLSEPEFSWL
jgi:hypothetical protein